MKVKDYIKFLCRDIFIKFLCRKAEYKKRYDISICAIFKDEAPFLKEWIEMNHLVGVNHFYMYNNNSSDSYLEVLEPYVDSGLVTLVDFPYDHAQMKAYNHFYETYRNETQWVAFVDIDEFFVPLSHLTLREWIKPYEKYPAIQIYWKMFGTAGKWKHDYSKLVTEQYHICWKHLDHCGKCLINTDYDIASFEGSVHHCPTMLYPFMGKNILINAINIFHRSTIGEGTFRKTDESCPTIQINHYWTKAWDIYDSKRKKTDVIFKDNPKKDLSYFLYHENKNCDVDYSIYKYLMQLKLKLSNID